MTNTGEKEYVKVDWWSSRRLFISLNTTVVTIQADDTENADRAWIPASFSNGVVTDSSWQCV